MTPRIENAEFEYNLTIGNLVKKESHALLLEDPLISKLAPWRKMLRTISETWGTPSCRGRGSAKHSPHMRTPEIHQKSSGIYVLENEPGDVGRLAEASGITKDDI